MAFAETANLAVKLTLGGNFTSQLAKARAGLRGLEADSRGFKAGQQIGTGIKRGAILAVAGIGALTALVAQSVKDGQDAANVQKIYAQAIANSGKVTQDYVTILNDQQKALMELSGVDDELIKTEQTRLIQMGLTGKQVATATPLILDFAKATGIDLLTATKLFGKAAQGNVGALSRYGVQIDKAKAKVDPFGAAVDALNGKFGGTTRALSGSLDTRLAAFQEGLRNIREEAGIKLLPVLTRIVDVAGKELVPAFAKFVDRILPQLEDGLNGFADLLSNGGAAKGIQSITDALGPMVELVKIAAAPVKAIVNAFLALPKEVQTVLVGAFAVNKLTGGLVTNAAGGIIEAIGKGLLGGIKAPLVNVQGGVVNVGGVPGVGAPGGNTPAGFGARTLISAAIPVAAGIAAGTVIALNQAEVFNQPGADPKAVNEGVKNGTLLFNGRVFQIVNKPTGYNGMEDRPSARTSSASGYLGMESRPKVVTDPKTKAAVAKAAAEARAKADAQSRALAEAKSAIANGDRRAQVTGGTIAAKVAAAGVATASALRSLPMPIVTTTVNVAVTAAGISKTVTTQSRYGPAAGSRDDPRFSGYVSGV
jgi:hypothetical protein